MVMHSIRPAAVAGSFYPADRNQLDSDIEYYLTHCHQTEFTQAKAFIVPHAGIQYSGIIAASVYSAIARSAQSFERVILMGPCHRVWIEGMAIPAVDSFESPLGNIPLDKNILQSISQFPDVQISDVAHQDEHSLEVQLPFLQKALQNFSLVPILVGEVDCESVAEMINFLWSLDDTLFLISSDLSHFHDYDTASKIDRQTTMKIINKDYHLIDHHMACGCTPIQGILSVAKSKHLPVNCIKQCNSGDTAGDKSRVVGYASYAIG